MTSTAENPNLAQPVIVTGFIGSGHEVIGQRVAEYLGRFIYDTFNDPLCQAAFTDDAGEDLTSRLEIYNSLVMFRADIPPRVLLVRAQPFGRLLMQHTMESQGAISIFVDTPPPLILAHLAEPRWQHAGNESLTRAAERDVLRNYEETAYVARHIATITIRPNVWPGDLPDTDAALVNARQLFAPRLPLTRASLEASA
ncbi:MAG TPA: hypothetical protein VLF91_04975 [Candidatus Saccharimonadales bacterium]|nr:hypothetical protein [Candidatus Saccharimonadales bacterium]